MNTAIIVAGGSGQRFGGDKVFADLGGMPALARTITVFDTAQLVDAIIVVARAERVADVQSMSRRFGWRKVRLVVPGGARRQDSVLNGVRASAPGIVLIHDAARPLLPGAVISRGLAAVKHTGAAIAALPLRDTVKEVSGAVISGTRDRSNLWAAQTPQIFQRGLILSALETSVDVTDDASAVEACGGEVEVFLGDERNFKITTPADLALAEAIVRCG